MNIVEHQRNAHIRRVREALNGKGRQRTSLSQAEAEKVAMRIGRLLCQAVERSRRLGQSVSMRGIAKEVWPDHGENYASSNLQRFILPQGLETSRRSLKLTKTARSYVPLAEVIAKYLDRDPDDVLIEVFQGTAMDTEKLQADVGYALNGNEFEAWLWERARQLGERHHLAGYYRNLCLTGGIRDLERQNVTLVPGDLCEPLAGDLLEAGFLPVLTAADRGLSIACIWQGLVPTVPLYRIQIAPRTSGMLRVNKKVLQELVPVELIRLYEVRFGVAPIDKSGVSGPLFECVEMLALEEKRTGRRLIPQNPYRSGGPGRAFGMMPEDGVFWRGTEQIQGSLCAGELPPQSDILPELDPEYEAVVFEPADFERCHKFLVEWPERFPHRIETEDLEWPTRQGETEPSVFPSGTLGAVVETELCRDEGLWRRLETQADALIAAYHRYRQQQSEAVRSRQACVLQRDSAAYDPEIAKSLLELRPVDWRKRLGLTQQAAARLLGVAPRTYVYYEHGKKSLPRPVRLAMDYCELHRERAEALADTVDYLIEGEISHA